MAMHTIINTSRIAAVLLLLSFATHNLYAQEPDSVLVAQGTVSVSGTIMDASTGAPLEGINVSIPGHSSAITNQDGAFTIAAPGSTATLMQLKAVPKSRSVFMKPISIRFINPLSYCPKQNR
jgi:hypothetical protein